ncbi:hypothetical protein AKJ16_DCAP24618 [Drosera capensis]
MATTQSASSSSSSTDFFHGDDLCNWDLVEHDDDSNFWVQSLDSFSSSSSDDETLETGRPGIDYSFPEILNLIDGMIPPLFVGQDSDVDDRGDGNGTGDDDGACGVAGFYSGSIDLKENPFLELESLRQFIDPEGYHDAGVSSRIEGDVGNGLCENGSFDDPNGGDGGDGGNGRDVVVCDAGSMAVDLGQNPFLEWDSLYQFIANAILDASVHQVGSDSETALGDVNGGVGMSSKIPKVIVKGLMGVYANGDRSDEHDALDGYHGDPEVKVDIGQISKVQEAGEDDDEEDVDMGEFDDEYDLDDELVPWGLAHQLRSQRMWKLAKRPCAKMTKSKRYVVGFGVVSSQEYCTCSYSTVVVWQAEIGAKLRD